MRTTFLAALLCASLCSAQSDSAKLRLNPLVSELQLACLGLGDYAGPTTTSDEMGRDAGLCLPGDSPAQCAAKTSSVCAAKVCRPVEPPGQEAPCHQVARGFGFCDDFGTNNKGNKLCEQIGVAFQVADPAFALVADGVCDLGPPSKDKNKERVDKCTASGATLTYCCEQRSFVEGDCLEELPTTSSIDLPAIGDGPVEEGGPDVPGCNSAMTDFLQGQLDRRAKAGKALVKADGQDE